MTTRNLEVIDLEKSVLKAFDKFHNTHNDISEAEALQMLSQLSPAAVSLCKDDDKFTLLHYACHNGWYKMAKLLIEIYSCDQKCKNIFGSIPLRLACLSGCLDLVKYLIVDRGGDCNHRNNLGLTNLHNASLVGCLDVVKYLVEEQNCDPACKSNDGWSPLHCASQNCHLDVVKYFIEERRCDPTCKSNSGWTPLHSAYKNGHLHVAKYLVEEHNCDPVSKTKSGWTSLHSACQSGHLNVTKCLIERYHCDPACRRNDGWTPLHSASEYGHLELVRYLIEEQKCDPACKITSDWTSNNDWAPLHSACQNGHINIARYLVEEQGCDPACTSSDGWTPLHLACQSGHLNVAKFLIEKWHCDPACTNNDGCTPLHSACQSGHLDMVRYLVEEKHCDPEMKSYEWTPLHSACKNGHLNVVKYLVEEQHCDPKCTINAASPLALACKLCHFNLIVYLVNKCNCSLITDSELIFTSSYVKDHGDIVLFLQSSSVFINGPMCAKLKQILFHPAFKMFVVGNAFSGKSTLVKAIQSHFLNNDNWFTKQYKRLSESKVTGVEPYTAGIIPVNVETPHRGRMIIYDFAGHHEYYSSHAAFCERLMPTYGSLVMVMFNLSKSVNECVQEVQYWRSFIDNQLKSSSQTPVVFIVASYADVVKLQGQNPLQKAQEVVQTSFGEINEYQIIVLDCRLEFSADLQTLATLITKHCTNYQKRVVTDIKLEFLRYLIRTYLVRKVACQLRDIMRLISTEKNSLLHNNDLLPESVEEVECHLTTLNEGGELLYLNDNQDIRESWVILKKHMLLAEVNGTMFAPGDFKQHQCISNNTGVVPLSNIKKVFPSYDPLMLVGFMTHLEFCHLIAECEALLISGGEIQLPKSVSDTYYFFPALVSSEKPRESFNFFTTTHYKCGWCLQRVNDNEFVTSRFLHTMLIRLMFTFALQCESEDHSIVIQRECNVWKNGIHWQSSDGVEAIVEVVEQSTAVVVVMGCLKGRERECIYHRSRLIQAILLTKEEFIGAVEMREGFFHPKELHLPPQGSINSYFAFPINRVAKTIAERKEVITSKFGTKQEMIEISTLLHFEPFACLTPELISILFNEDISELNIPDTFFLDFARVGYPKMTQLKKILLLYEHESELVGAIEQCRDQYRKDSTHQCFLVLITWKKFTKDSTYKGLREALGSHSVFCGRNPLQLT